MSAGIIRWLIALDLAFSVMHSNLAIAVCCRLKSSAAVWMPGEG